MKKNYEVPEWEIISLSQEELIMVSSSCPSDCSDDCSACYYLVCEPQDVIIGG